MPEQHWFVSSVAGFGTGESLNDAVDSHAKNAGRGFTIENVALVPGPHTASYKVDRFLPQVAGCVFLRRSRRPQIEGAEPGTPVNGMLALTIESTAETDA